MATDHTAYDDEKHLHVRRRRWAIDLSTTLDLALLIERVQRGVSVEKETVDGHGGYLKAPGIWQLASGAWSLESGV